MPNKYEKLRVRSEDSAAEVIIPVDPDLKIREELVGPHAVNPLVQHNSSARSYMYTAHQSQSVTLIDGDTPILETGVDSQLSKHTFGPVAEHDCVVMRVIPKYGNISDNFVNEITGYIYITFREEFNEETGRTDKYLDYIDVPLVHSGYHQNFGFAYKHNKDIVGKIRKGDTLLKDTRIAVSPSIRENGGYALGVNANMIMCTHPDVAEDSVIISQSLAEKMRYHVIEKKEISFGSDYLPLNIYGDDKNYKPFPEIGDMVGEDAVLVALRNFRDFGYSKTGNDEDPKDFTPALLSAKDLRRYNPIFDKCTYVRSPGEIIKLSNGTEEKSGVVIDITCYKNDKKVSDLYFGMDKIPNKYARSYIKYHEDILTAYDAVCQELYDVQYGYGKDVILKSPRLHNLIVKAGIIAYDSNVKRIKNNKVLMDLSKKIKFTKETSSSNLPNRMGLANRNEPLDSYRLEFTIRYTIILDKGHKISDQSGGKGVISEVRPDHLMPYNEYGRADIIMDRDSIISRMNLARMYIQYFGAASRFCKANLLAMANGVDAYHLDETTLESMFTYLMGFLGKFDTPQFDYYSKATLKEKREILNECLTDEVKIMYQISNTKTAYQIVSDIRNSQYSPPSAPVVIPIQEEDGTIKKYVTKDPIYIAPLYIILVCKTADNMLFTSSPNLNNFLFPIPVVPSNRDRLPYRNTPTKIISETEGRLYSMYVGREAMAELKDRANSVPTHKAMYNTLLTADKPTGIYNLIDRSKVAFGNDSSIKLVRSIFKQCGFDIHYVKGRY